MSQYQPGEQINKYILDTRLGNGYFGEVYLARDIAVDAQYAIKIIESSPSGNFADLREAKIGNKVSHPNLVKVHSADVVNYQGRYLTIIAMDYYPSGSVISACNGCGFLGLRAVHRIIMDILRGLEYLHSLGYYHNDIKPSNILISPSGGGMLTDYGIAQYSPDLCTLQVDKRYLLHSAPETVQNNIINTQTDIYQVGMTCFRLLNGLDFIYQKISSLSPDERDQEICKGLVGNSDYQAFVPTSLKRVINKSTNPDPTRRYLKAIDMLRALERLAFSGDWNCDDNGNLLGEDEKNQYWYDPRHIEDSSKSFTAWKKSKHSGKETRILKYRVVDSNISEIEKKRRNFMQDVVTGKI